MTDIVDNTLGYLYQYTALGSSIAFGMGASFGIAPINNNYGYVHYLRDFLDMLFPNVHLMNHATPGFDSSDLLNQLQNDENVRNSVKNANIISLSIGGADLINCFDDPECLENAVFTFSHNWKQILNVIRHDLNTKAKILVMTVYNPFAGDDQPNFDRAELYIQQINQVLKGSSTVYRYLVVNVHDEFLGQFTDTTQWKVCLWTHSCKPLSSPDSLPTDSGHFEIARLHQLELLKPIHPIQLY